MRSSPAHRSLILLLAALGLALGLLLPGRQTRAVTSPTSSGTLNVERSGKEPGLHVKVAWPADFPRTLQDLGFYAGVQTGAVWTALVLITVYLLFHQRSQP